MSAARPTLQRLIVATAAAMGSLLVASWLVGLVLPAHWQEVVQTRWGFLAPVSYVVTALCMGLGGALAGRRFLIVAVGLTLAVWIATLSVLAGIAGAASDMSYPLGFLLRTNALSATLSVVAAALGTWLGALWYARR